MIILVSLKTMFLWRLLQTNPFAGLALLITLGTLFWCLKLVQRQHTKMDRYLMALLGLIAMYQGLHIVQNAGFWSLGEKMQNINSVVDMTVAALYLVSTLILQISCAERHNTRIQLRVMEANQPAPRPSKPLPSTTERSALAVFGISASGEVNLWHNSSEEFFGCRRDEVLGTRMPFKDPLTNVSDATSGTLPQMLRLRSKHHDELDAIVWFMPVPGEASSLVLVLDYRKVKRAEPADDTQDLEFQQVAG